MLAEQGCSIPAAPGTLPGALDTLPDAGYRWSKKTPFGQALRKLVAALGAGGTTRWRGRCDGESRRVSLRRSVIWAAQTSGAG
jgi:hypothetical protein